MLDSELSCQTYHVVQKLSFQNDIVTVQTVFFLTLNDIDTMELERSCPIEIPLFPSKQPITFFSIFKINEFSEFFKFQIPQNCRHS